MQSRLKEHDQHEGEVYVQQRRHAPSSTPDIVSQYIRDDMPEEHSDFFTHLSYFALATLDADDRPWATIIVGAPTTLVRAVSKMELEITAVLPEGDPFVSSVISTSPSSRRYFAGVGVDFRNRRRNKVAGLIAKAQVQDHTLHMSLITNESLGNCPKYITVRRLEYFQRQSALAADHRNDENVPLDRECRKIIDRASTVFLATRHTGRVSDLGLNHRGGAPGFVRTYEDNGSAYIVVPDYSGNRFYQSLGNIQTDHVAGLVFPCFATGDMLHVTGIAENLFDDEAERLMPRVTLLTRIKVTGHVHIRAALNLQLHAPEQLSPYNPSVRCLASELEQMGKVTKSARIPATLIDIKRLTRSISKFTFRLDEDVVVKPGQFAIFDFGHLMGRAYRHMNDARPKSINDDYLRTWTISSSAPFDPLTSTFQSTNTISCTIKHVPKGAISSLLHARPLDPQSPLLVKLVGIGGEFTCYNERSETPSKLLFIAGGVGLTPFLAMFESLSSSKPSTDLVVLFACRDDEINLLTDFVSSPIVTSITVFDSTGANASTELTNVKIHNRRMQSDDLNAIIDLRDRHVYICGPTSLMADATTWLRQAGVQSDRIRTETFLF